jgi:hypothetical protein
VLREKGLEYVSQLGVIIPVQPVFSILQLRAIIITIICEDLSDHESLFWREDCAQLLAIVA